MTLRLIRLDSDNFFFSEIVEGVLHSAGSIGGTHQRR